MAYTEAVVKSVEANPDGSQRLNLVYIGDAGEPPIPDTLTVAVATVPDQNFLRRHAISKLTTLNATKEFKSLVQPGMVIDTTTPLPGVTPPTQDEEERDAFLTAIAAYKATVAGVPLGVTTTDDVTAAAKGVQALYQDKFLLLLRGA